MLRKPIDDLILLVPTSASASVMCAVKLWRQYHSSSLAKMEQFEPQNEVVSDYILMYKINILKKLLKYS